MIRLSLAMTALTARIPPALWSVTMAWVTRLGWHPAQNGLVAVTWTLVTGHRPGTSSACNGFWRLLGSAAATPTQPRRRTSPTTPGIARRRKVVRLTRCRLLSKHKLLLVL